MDLFPDLLILLALSTVVLPLGFWSISSRMDQRLRILSAWFAGLVLPAGAGWALYRSEGGYALVAFVIVTALAALISIVTVMIVSDRSARQ